MLRTTASSFTKTASLRSSAIFSSVRHYTTPDAATTPAAETKKERSPLSQRIGGTGRGKVMEGATDPFASFLANARKPRSNNNNNRNGNFTPRPRKQNTENKGQFADATETTNNEQQQRKPRMRTEGNNNKNRNNNRPNNRQQKTEGAAQQQANNKRQPRENNKQRATFRARSQPQEVRTRRATTFIDKDIDWSSFETATLNTESTEQEVASEQDNGEMVLKDIAGDYDRYLGVGSDIKWPEIIQGATVSTLVGSNPTFDLQQKTAFLAALTSATSNGAVGARK
jgi:flagellar biosynthesis GTPase FlhF